MNEALRPIARYKIGYHADEWGQRSSTPGGIPDHAGSWVRYEDHVAALAEAQQPVPSAAVALSDDLRDRLVAISAAIADQDDRAAQAMLILPQTATGDSGWGEHPANPGDTEAGPEGEWYCETHPDQLMGHGGCGGAGIPACARIGMLTNQLRLARQEIREAGLMRDEMAAAALRVASHGQALRLLTQNEKDSLGRRAEGMDGNEWDQWVQEKFAQVNGLRVQGGNYDWE